MKTPLLPIALAYAAGLGWSRHYSPPLVLLLALAGGALAVCVFRRARSDALLWGLGFLLGAASLTARQETISPGDLRLVLEGRPALGVLRGEVLRDAEPRLATRGDTTETHWQTVVQADRLVLAGATQTVSGRVLVRFPDPEMAGKTRRGARLEARGVLSTPRGAEAPGLPDYRAILARRGIHHILTMEPADSWTARRIPDGALDRLPERFAAWARGILAMGIPEGKTSGLTQTMLLGWTIPMEGESLEELRRTGTLHIFAISGLHVTFIAAILATVALPLGLERRWLGAAVIPLVWFYTAATGWQPSAIRAAIMISLVLLGKMLLRPLNLTNSLAASAWLILIWDPGQLFQPGFQLSFTVVAAIILCARFCEPAIAGWLGTDPLLPASLIPPAQLRRLRLFQGFAMNTAIGVGCWIGSAPLIAGEFHMVSFAGLWVNLLAVPATSVVLLCGMASLLLGAIHPLLATPGNALGWLFMELTARLVEWAATLPGTFAWVGPFPTAWLAAFYGLLLAALFEFWRHRWSLAVVGLFLLSTCGWAVWEGATARKQWEITVLPWRGNPIWIDPPSKRHRLLVDTSTQTIAAGKLTDYLHHQGITRVGAALLTHGDVAHVGGLGVVREGFGVPRVFTSFIPGRSGPYRQVIKSLANDPGWETVRRGDLLYGWEVLHPDVVETDLSRADDVAIVLRRRIHGVSILLLGDLGEEGQRRLLEREPGIQADVVVASMPAQGEPLLQELLAQLQPRLVVMATAEFPARDQGPTRLRERLRDSGIPTLYTSDQGAVRMVLSERGAEAKPMDGGSIPLR